MRCCTAPTIAAGQPAAERNDPNYRDVILESRLRQALARLNPDLPPEALEDAFRKLTEADAPSLIERNRAVHRMLVDGVTVEYRRKDGSIAGAQARRDRLRRSRQQRLARRQPVHRRRGAAHAPAGRGGVRQRPAAGGDRAEERGRRERRPSGRRSSSFRPIRRKSRRCSRPTRCWSCPTACRRASARSAPARSGSSPGARSPAATTRPKLAELAGGAGGRVREAPVPRPGAALHRVRGRGRRQARQEDGRLPPVPRRQRGAGRNAARGDPGAELAQVAGFAEEQGRYDAGRWPAATRATAASAWSGTRRAPARA